MFRGLLEAAPDAIVGVDADGRIALVNAQVEALFGYSREELIGQPVEILVPEAAREIHPGHREGYFSHPVTRPMGAGMELAGRRRDGSEFPAEISLSAIETEEGLLVSAAIRDGTDRKQAAIIASSADAILSKDLHRTITSWNPAAERLFGHRATEVLGRGVDILIPAELLDEERDLLARVAAGQAVAEYETVRVSADGSQIPVAITMSPIRDPGGTIVGVSTIARDLTERKRAEAERQALEQRLNQSQRLESLGQLAGGIAHDFNNLLAVILNYATFVAEEVGDNVTARDDVEAIRAAAERAARLTQQLLIFGRRETVQPEVLDLNTVVADIEHLLSRTIGEHVEQDVRSGSDPCVVRVDRGQLEQVIVNLAVNARDAMPDGGVLTIETASVTLDDEYARGHPDIRPGRYVQLSVSDTGVGMDDQVIAHAFEPFFTTKVKGEGSGLGLATVYGIVTEAGGNVTLYSTPGLGTTVRVHLPAVDAPVAAPEPGADRPRPIGRGQSILVVEDEEAMRKVTARILRRNGYEVLEAAGADDGLRIAATKDFDLLLTDVVMPQVSGPDLAQEVLRLKPGVRVLFMSGYSQGVLGPRRGLTDELALIQKPFNEQSLVDRVSQLLDGSSSRRGPGLPE